MYNSRHGADRVSMSRTIVSHYDLLEELGHGGGGRVYRALDLNLGRPVALKFLLPSLVNSPDARARFLREGQALSALSHPHIATVFEVGEAPQGPFLALEYLPGGSLRDRIRAACAGGFPLKLSHVVG